MKKRSLVLAAFAIAAATTRLHAQIGTLTDESYNPSTGYNYVNASSIPVSSTDLLEGLTPISTNYVGQYEATGGTTAVLTDGTTGMGQNAASDSTTAAFDLSGDWYAEYKLPTATLGYNLSSVVVTTGAHDFRVGQHYDILVSTDGVNFTSLSDGATDLTLGTAGGEFTYAPSAATGLGGAAQSTVSPVATNLGTGIKYVEFVVEAGGEDMYRELDVNGSPTVAPEPSAWALLVMGGAGLLAWRRRASRA